MTPLRESLKQELEDAAVGALEQAGKLGATSAEAAASVGTGLSVNVRLGEVDKIEHGSDHSFTVTVYFGKQKGSASTASLAIDELQEITSRACQIAKYTASDAYAGLADADMLARDCVDLDLDHPWGLDPQDAISLAVTCEDAARSNPRIVNSEGASVDTSRSMVCYANTHGIAHTYAGTSHTNSCVVIAGDGNGLQRDYWYTVNRHPGQLMLPEEVGKRASERARRRLGARKLKTCKASILFAPETARSLLSHFASAVSGGSLYRKASFLLDTLGKKIFSDLVHIREEPLLPGAIGSAPFDADGVATQTRTIVDSGKLEGYFLGSYSARKLGMCTTGNAGGIHNLILQPGSGDCEDMMKAMGTGLLVTELIGQGANILTGDYSRGVSGFWVEKGEIAYPVQEITIAGNLKNMFAGISAVGADVDERANIRSGSVLVNEMMIAGN